MFLQSPYLVKYNITRKYLIHGSFKAQLLGRSPAVHREPWRWPWCNFFFTEAYATTFASDIFEFDKVSHNPAGHADTKGGSKSIFSITKTYVTNPIRNIFNLMKLVSYGQQIDMPVKIDI